MTRFPPRRTATGYEFDRPARSGLGRAPLGVVLLAALAAEGCDNPACVFSPTQCQPDDGTGGPGGIGSFSAIFPNDASWIAPSAPSVVRSGPAIEDAHPETPLMVEFDQSLDPASLSGAFELLDSLTLTPVPLLDPPALVGDGRVVVLTVPSVGQTSPLMPGTTYLLRFTDDQEISDVTGQAFDFGTGQDIFEFGVSATPPTNPRVVYTYPRDDAILASDLTEVVVVFDRTMDVDSFSNMSFLVTVNDALTPLNPGPSTLFLAGLQVPTPALQVWRWSHAQGNGPRQSLGADARMRVRLSPTGTPPLEGRMGGTLPQTDIDFRTALVRAPASVLKATNALPLDAIGGPNLDAGGVLQVTFADPAGANDTLDVFIIGGSRANAQLLKAEQRTIAITPTGATSIVLGEAELDLREPNGTPRFRDGEIEFMTRIRRGTAATVARRADGNPTAAGFQRLFQDLTPPRLLGLGVDASSVTLVRSELGGIVIVGLGDEEIRYARVTATVGGLELHNQPVGQTGPPVVALASPGGRFIAAPVIDAPYVLDPSPSALAVPYTVEVFDRALNPAAAAVGTYQQIGSVGPGAAPASGGLITVRVFDADTGALLDDSLVMSHADDGSNLVDLDWATTLAGSAEVPAAVAGATVVTVQRTGYDSFTFHGVPVDRLDVPLTRAGTAAATIRGVVNRPLTADFAATTNRLGDNRAPQPGNPLTPTTGCGLTSTGQPQCAYGPTTVRPWRLGLTTFFAVILELPSSSFSGQAFLRGSAMRLADEALGYGTNAVEQNLTVNELANTPEAFAGHRLYYSGLSLGTVDAPPTITVEGFAYGLEGAPTLGIGKTEADALPPAPLLVLGAIPFDATAAGPLVTLRAIEADLYLRAELVDTAGNRAGARPIVGTAQGQSMGDLRPIDVPRFLVPGEGMPTGGESYGIEVADVIPDSLGLGGLYRAVLTDAAGRRWHLWTVDPPGSANVRLAVPPVAGLGGSPLMDGAQMARVSAWALDSPDFALTGFLWADVDRRHKAFAHTKQTPFTQD